MGIVKRKAENDQDKVKTKQPETNKIISDSKILDIIMNNSQDTIYFKDKDSKFIANSKAHAMQVNCENLKDMVGKSDFDFFPEEFAMQTYLDEKKIMETGIPILGKQEKLQLLDGNYIWVLASKYPITFGTRRFGKIK